MNYLEKDEEKTRSQAPVLVEVEPGVRKEERKHSNEANLASRFQICHRCLSTHGAQAVFLHHHCSLPT